MGNIVEPINYMGKPIDELSRDELLEALKVTARLLREAQSQTIILHECWRGRSGLGLNARAAYEGGDR